MSAVSVTPSLVSRKTHGRSVQTFSHRDTGRTLVDAQPNLPTYSVGASFSAAASATDVLAIVGSATKRVEINKIVISGVQTTAGIALMRLIRRSTDNTAGTSTTPAIVKHAIADPNPTAVVRAYTANPSALGTEVGIIRSVRVPIGVATGASDPVVLDFGASGKPLVLTGVAQVLALNLNGATLTGNTLDISVEFTESSLTSGTN